MSEIRPRRVLFVQHAGVGGALISLSQILAHLDRERFDVTVLLLRNDQESIELLEKCQCEVIVDDRLSQFRHVFGGWSLLEPIGLYFSIRSLIFSRRSLSEFRKLLEQIQPDLIYLNALPVSLYAHLARQKGIPVILHVREITLDGLLGIRRNLQRRVIERSVDHIIYIGEFEQARLGVRSGGSVIPNYIDLCLWNRDHVKEHLDLNTNAANTPTILFVGGLNSIKGIQILLPALRVLKRRGSAFRCIFLGIQPSATPKGHSMYQTIFPKQGMDFEEVSQFVQKAELVDECEFKPFVTQPIEEYLQADILVFPSTVPHFPRPIIEAGALSIPAIASNLPGPQSVIKDGKNGFLVEPRNPHLLANAISTLIQDPELRKQMGEANYEVVQSKFNAAVNKRRILDLIERMSGMV